MQRIAFVRRPSPRLDEGIVTHIEREPVDVARAFAQHESYVDTLKAQGFAIAEVAPQDDCPDSVFIEDALLIVGDLAIATRPGASARLPEVRSAEQAAVAKGLKLARIPAPATLDGGDILQVGDTIYAGLGDRTNEQGIQVLKSLVEPLGRNVITVPLHGSGVLHLKSAVTALPDGTFVLLPDSVPIGLFPGAHLVDEPAGCHVVPLGGSRILMATSAQRTAEKLAAQGFTPVLVDIGEFEKLEGCVTCLCVLTEEA